MKYTREQLRAMAQEVLDGLMTHDAKSTEVVARLRERFGMGYIEVVAAIARLAL